MDFIIELNAVKSAYTPTCNICVTDTTFNVVRAPASEARFPRVEFLKYVNHKKLTLKKVKNFAYIIAIILEIHIFALKKFYLL